MNILDWDPTELWSTYWKLCICIYTYLSLQKLFQESYVNKHMCLTYIQYAFHICLQHGKILTFMSCKLYSPTFLIGGSTNRRWALDETVLVLVPSRREAEKVPCWVRPVAGGKPGDHNFGIIVFRKLKMMGFQVRNLLFQGAIFRLHVKLLEVFWPNLLKMAAFSRYFLVAFASKVHS